MLNRLAFAFALLLVGCAAAAADECKELANFEHDEAAAIGGAKYYDTFMFRKDQRGDNVLLLFKDSTERGKPPKHWLYVRRPQPDVTGYCLVARGSGETFTYHDDKPEKLYAADFGFPGSQHPRCAASRPGVPAPAVLRGWANRTLGEDDAVFDVHTPDQGGYQFAIAQDQNWIIIRDNADDPETSCLYDLGPDVFMRFDRRVPAP